MSIDTEDRPTNVKKLVVPERPKFSGIDIGKILGPQDWQEITTTMLENKDHLLALRQNHILSLLKIVDLPRFRDFYEKNKDVIDDYSQGTLASIAVVARTNGTLTIHQVSQLRDLAIIYGSDYVNDIMPEGWLRRINNLTGALENNQIFIIISEASELKLLGGLDESDISQVDWYGKQLKDKVKGHIPSERAQYLADLRILGINITDDVLTDSEIEGLLANIEPHKRLKNYINLLTILSKLAMAKAFSVKVTEGGLEVIMRDPEVHLAIPPQVPVTKKY